MLKKRVFAIFAHNEEKNIVSSIKSVQSQSDSDIYVLINGCTDNTQKIVEDYASTNTNIIPVFIEIGDKSNAWNVFVHDLMPEAELYYFLDGDCNVGENAISIIEKALVKDCPLPNVIAATPEEITKSRIKTTMEMLTNGGLAGNFYALTNQFVDRIRAQKIKLPLGTIGEDSLVGALAYWNLVPFSDWNLKNILVLRNAKFTYTPLSIFNFSDLKLYYRRKIRYSHRFFQNKVIKECFRENGLKGINKPVNELLKKHPEQLQLNWRGLDTYFDWIALRQIKKQ